MAFLQPEIAIDLGTVNVLVHEKGRGIVIQEPAVVAIKEERNRKPTVVEVGRAARDMYGRTSEHLEVMRPLRDGVIADFFVTEKMLEYFINKTRGRFRRRPIVMITVPYGVTSVERRAVREAGLSAGAGEVRDIHQPLAAAVGAGLPVGTPTGNLVVDMGGGSTEAAIVSVNNIVCAESVRVAGVHLDDAIVQYVRKKYNLVIGEPTAEAVKIKLGSAVEPDEREEMNVQGRDQVTGLPRTITITSSEVAEALEEPLNAIVNVVKAVLAKTPPELSADIIDRGMALTGGTALLREIDTLLTNETGVPAYVADNPVACTALGAGRALADWQVFQRSRIDL